MKILSILAAFGLVCVVAGDSDNETTEMRMPTPSLRIIINTTRSSQVARDHESIYMGSEILLICDVIKPEEESQLGWTKDGLYLTDVTKSNPTIEVTIASNNDTGNFTCQAKTMDGRILNSKTIDLNTEPVTILAEKIIVPVRTNKSASLSCILRGHSMSNLTWVKTGPNNTELSMNSSTVLYLHDTPVKMILNFVNVSGDNNGTYKCRAKYYNVTMTSWCHLKAIDVPELISANFVKSVGKGKVYLNWMINEHNEPLQNYSIDRIQKGMETLQTHVTVSGRGNSSHLLVGLGTGIEYKFRISASNSVGSMSAIFSSDWTTILNEDPEFVVSNVSILKMSGNSITIVWTTPPVNLREYFQYYNIMMNHSRKEQETRYCPAEIIGIYKFTNIKTSEADGYRFRVQACNNYTKQCCHWSNWSEPITASTSTATSLKPTEIGITANSLFSKSQKNHQARNKLSTSGYFRDINDEIK